jgi:hypothetical protein
MNENFQEMLDVFAASGLQILFIYGPVPGKGVFWSVDVRTPDGKTFDKPFSAVTFIDCLAIATQECSRRGWL